MDPDKAENEIKENTEPEIPSIAVVLVAPTALAVTLIILAAAPVTPVAAFTTPVIAPTIPAATLMSTRIIIPALLN